jgi:prepilin-type N-terminal cleavage/methylation domain-containing protein
MKSHIRRSGFTLVEVLIVVVILAILAATVIPQFATSTTDAKESALKFNLHSLRSQIEMYKLHHLGAAPRLTSGSLPQLTSATNVNGEIGTAGPSYPYGPYIMTALPPNPITGKSVVTATSAFPPTAESGAGGWLYHEATGQIAPDSAGYLNW